MAGRVEHLDGPCAAVEDPVDVFHAGVEARLADVAEEGSDQRPEVEGVIRWNWGWSLCKKTRCEEEEENAHHFHGKIATESNLTNSTLPSSCIQLLTYSR